MVKFANGLASVDSPTQFQEARAEMVNLYVGTTDYDWIQFLSALPTSLR